MILSTDLEDAPVTLGQGMEGKNELEHYAGV